MRNVSRLLLLLGVFAFASYTFAAQNAAPKAPAAPAAQQEKAFQGSLVKVDNDAKTLTAKDANNKEMVFHYTDKTEVVGSDNSIQGLAGKTGTQLNITYSVDKGANNATRIEMSR